VITDGSRPGTITRVDREILERFRDGDEAAVKTLYERFRGPVFAISMRILRDHGLAGDATQQTFVKAWQAAARFDPERDPGPWLFAIARRTAIDVYRKNRRTVPSDEIVVEVTSPGIERVWETFQVRSALDRLPDEEREVLRLSHFEGLSHAEIAEHMGVPIGTVKSRSHRGHQRLIEMLGHIRESE
jgi:RNA polymerase sigma factor (sigma-70 family)